MSAGGVLCAECSGKGMGLELLSRPALAVLRRLQETADPASATRMVLDGRLKGEIAGVLRRHLLAHVEGLRTLRSESVFSSLL